MEEQESWIALTRALLPPRKARALLEAFDSPTAAIAAGDEHLARAGLTDSEKRRLRHAAASDLSRDLALMERLGVSLVTIRDFAYPPNLREIHDPPIALYLRGQLAPDDRRAIAVVGTRRASSYGAVVAEALARDLAVRGITVVSGMARGSDSAAHRGALAARGRTIAVLPCGLDICYPPENRDLMEQIIASGAVVSELPFGTRPARMVFHARNRIISGMTLGTIVVEAPERSGALITAAHAAEQGRQVFAVPGSVNSSLSRGTHGLIKDGAKLVQTVEDVLEEVELPGRAAPGPAAREQPAEPALSDEEKRLLALLTLEQRHADDLIEETGFAPSQVSSSLLMLELKGLVRRLPGNMFMRVG
jgi:DNA processing protein